jgi:hypothetical protein
MAFQGPSSPLPKGFSCSILCQDTFRWKRKSYKSTGTVPVRTEESNRMNKHTCMYVMYKTGYRYLTYISSIFRYYRTVCELFSLVILKK